jgi:hypothetical protein
MRVVMLIAEVMGVVNATPPFELTHGRLPTAGVQQTTNRSRTS